MMPTNEMIAISATPPRLRLARRSGRPASASRPEGRRLPADDASGVRHPVMALLAARADRLPLSPLARFFSPPRLRPRPSARRSAAREAHRSQGELRAGPVVTVVERIDPAAVSAA
jgi:hypothetical protein